MSTEHEETVVAHMPRQPLGNRAMVQLSLGELADLLDLPPGMIATHVTSGLNGFGIRIGLYDVEDRLPLSHALAGAEPWAYTLESLREAFPPPKADPALQIVGTPVEFPDDNPAAHLVLLAGTVGEGRGWITGDDYTVVTPQTPHKLRGMRRPLRVAATQSFWRGTPPQVNQVLLGLELISGQHKSYGIPYAVIHERLLGLPPGRTITL